MNNTKRSSRTRKMRVLQNELNSIKNSIKPRRSMKNTKEAPGRAKCECRRTGKNSSKKAIKPKRSSRTRKMRVLQN